MLARVSTRDDVSKVDLEVVGSSREEAEELGEVRQSGTCGRNAPEVCRERNS